MNTGSNDVNNKVIKCERNYRATDPYARLVKDINNENVKNQVESLINKIKEQGYTFENENNMYYVADHGKYEIIGNVNNANFRIFLSEDETEVIMNRFYYIDINALLDKGENDDQTRFQTDMHDNNNIGIEDDFDNLNLQDNDTSILPNVDIDEQQAIHNSIYDIHNLENEKENNGVNK